jgi:soluble lytic murein transglycosylase-like protein
VLTLTLVGWSAHAASQAGSTLGISVIPSPHQPSQSKRLGLTELIKREAEQHGLPSELTDAFIATVSRYQATASGRFGEVGLMQIHPAAAKQHGFVGGTMDLYAPEHNIRYGTAHLVRAWSIADHDLCLTLLKYRTNYGEDEVTPAIAAECIE